VRRPTTIPLLVALAVPACSPDHGQAAALDLCGLVRDGDLPAGEQLADGFPKAGEDSCTWETGQGSSLRVSLWKDLSATALGEQWKVSPRRIADRDVYLRPTGFTEPGGPVIECSAGLQYGSDLLRLRFEVEEPRGDLCAQFVPVVEKIAGRLPS
jgi:hypothetical protein